LDYLYANWVRKEELERWVLENSSIYIENSLGM